MSNVRRSGFLKLGTVLLLVSGLFVLGVTAWSILSTDTLKEELPGVLGVKNNQTVLDKEVFQHLSSQKYSPEYKVEIFAEDLIVPWSVVFTSPDRLLVTERSGTVREIENGVVNPEPLIVFPEVSAKIEEGLMGLALDPDYDENKFVYTSLVYQRNPQVEDVEDLVLRVSRFVDDGEYFIDEVILLDGVHASKYHAGSRIKFGPDNKLYVTTGDGTDGEVAQDLGNLGGKILRMNSDGSAPEDNPFPDSLVYSYGHRNSQGLAWHPVTGELYITEHGPSGFDGAPGGDEINLIKPGQNYGWPLVSHEESREGMVDPLVVFTPATAPASADFYTGQTIPGFENDFFYGALRGEGVYRVVFDQDDRTHPVFYEKLEGTDKLGRIRDVAQGLDGYLYFTTSNTDTRGDAPVGGDRIYRIVPK